MSLKVAFFVWEYHQNIVGGLGTYAVELTRQLVEAGHDVVVFTLNTGNLLTHELWRGVMIHRPKILDLSAVFPLIVTEDLRRWGTNLQTFCDVFSYNHLSASKFLNELVRKEREHYDVACVHDWLSAVAGLIVKKELPELPLVYHVHSTEQLRSQGLGSEVIRHLERSMADSADKIVTVSYAMKDHLTSLGYPRERIHVVWNGVDPEKYDPEKVKSDRIQALRSWYGIDSDESVVLFVGRLTRVKGVRNLVQSIPLVVERLPRTRFVILGQGEESSDLVQLARRLGVIQKVSFRLEFVSEEERITHYAMSDVCVFPSISEPFGIVCLEAMSMAKPVVVGTRGLSGFKEQVIPSGPDQCGVHVNGEDPSDIAWGLSAALRDKSQAKIWGVNGRRRVLQLFDWKMVAENTLSVYRECIEGRVLRP